MFSCFIIDDEPIAGDIIESYIGRLEGFSVSGKFTLPLKAFEALKTSPVDLVFLDIQMPGITGLELLKALRNPPQVVLTTAYREFALEGFDLDATDYLLKPIAFERFLKAIDKFYARRTAGGVRPPAAPLANDQAANDHIIVRADRKHMRLQLADICYIESLKDYARIVTTGGKIVTKDSIAHFEEMLPARQFLRVHRSYIVALDKISAWSGEGLEIGKTLIPVGRTYKAMVENVCSGGLR